MIFENNAKAIYLQIVDLISDGIVQGKYNEGDRLPSVREYAASVEVNANTVMRSYEKLQQQGLIFNKRGVGFFVSPGAKLKIISMKSQQLVDKELGAIFNLLMHLGVTPDALKAEYEKFIENSQNNEK